MNITFGTDGWRAVIAEEFTFANVARVAQASADYWSSEIQSPKSKVFGREPKIVVGFDRRFFSDRFARTAAEILAGGNHHTTNSALRLDGKRNGRRWWCDDYRQP